METQKQNPFNDPERHKRFWQAFLLPLPILYAIWPPNAIVMGIEFLINYGAWVVNGEWPDKSNWDYNEDAYHIARFVSNLFVMIGLAVFSIAFVWLIPVFCFSCFAFIYSFVLFWES